MQFGRLPWFFGAIFGGVGYLLIGFGWWWILTQQHRLNTYVAAPARIVSSRMETSSSSKGQSTHRPVIRYSYEVAGTKYQSDQVRAMGDDSESGDWAERMVNQFSAGKKTTAYVSPVDPTRVFLSREPAWVPFLLAAFGWPFAAVGTWASFISYQGTRKLRPPVKGTDGWFELRQEQTLGGRSRLCALATLIWYGYLIVLVGSYLSVFQTDWDVFCSIVAIVGGLMGIIGLVQVGRSWWLSLEFNDAIVCASEGRFRLGDSIQVRLCQQLRRPVVVEGLSLGAVCMRSDRQQNGSSISYTPATEARSVWKSLEVAGAYPPDEQILTTTELTLPADAAASTRPWGPTYPFYQWFIVLKLTAEGQSVLNVRFPIIVESPEGVGGFAGGAGAIRGSNQPELP